MAAVAVTSANTNNTKGCDRCIVRTSAGIPYVILTDSTEGGIEVWKGNSSTPTSFTEQDAANNPASAGRYGSASAAIDSTGVIHIVYGDDNGTSPSVRYVTFNTGTDTFSGDVSIIADLGQDMISVDNIKTAISIDSNNIPHIVYIGYPKSGSNTVLTLYYNNRIGGAWNAGNIEIYGIGDGVGTNVFYTSLSISKDNIPLVAYLITGVGAWDLQFSYGNANDATSFTDVKITSDDTLSSYVNIVVDLNGDCYISSVGTPTSSVKPIIFKHLYANAWSTWSAGIYPTTNDSLCQVHSITFYNSVLYVFWERTTDNDIYYISYSGTWGSGTWAVDVDLEIGTYNTPKVRFSYLNNPSYSTYGIDYVFTDETASPDILFNTVTLTASQIKKFMGVTQAAIKKVIGVTNATMKKLVGVANV